MKMCSAASCKMAKRLIDNIHASMRVLKNAGHAQSKGMSSYDVSTSVISSSNFVIVHILVYMHKAMQGDLHKD